MDWIYKVSQFPPFFWKQYFNTNKIYYCRYENIEKNRANLGNEFDEPSTSQTSKILEKNEEEDIFEKLLADQITADTEDEFSKYFKEGPVNRKVCFKISKLFNLNVFLLILSD